MKQGNGLPMLTLILSALLPFSPPIPRVAGWYAVPVAYASTMADEKPEDCPAGGYVTSPRYPGALVWFRHPEGWIWRDHYDRRGRVESVERVPELFAWLNGEDEWP